jgi:hypothetical protein
MALIAAGGIVIGLAAPAAVREASYLINGASIKQHSIAGDRLKSNTVTGAPFAAEGGTHANVTTLTDLEGVTFAS